MVASLDLLTIVFVLYSFDMDVKRQILLKSYAHALYFLANFVSNVYCVITNFAYF